MKNIILTGSGSGFGLQAAKLLASQGHRIFATMRNITSTNADVANELRKWALYNNALIYVVELDVTSNDSTAKAIAEISKKTDGKIDVLINNAGLSYTGLSETLTIEQTEQMYQVNTIGPERMIKAVLPFMHKHKDGLIINITSAQTRHLIPILTTYNGTKAALDAVSIGYQYELKSSGIDVVTIQPGGYQTTDMNTKALQGKNPLAEINYNEDIKVFEKALKKYFEPSDYSGDPKEVAEAMLRLVEMQKGERPLWTIVGGGPNSEKFAQINHLLKEIVEDALIVLPQYFPAV